MHAYLMARRNLIHVRLKSYRIDGVSIGKPRSEWVQTDLNERVTGEWNEQEVAVQSLGSLIVPA